MSWQTDVLSPSSHLISVPDAAVLTERRAARRPCTRRSRRRRRRTGGQGWHQARLTSFPQAPHESLSVSGSMQMATSSPQSILPGGHSQCPSRHSVPRRHWVSGALRLQILAFRPQAPQLSLLLRTSTQGASGYGESPMGQASWFAGHAVHCPSTQVWLSGHLGQCRPPTSDWSSPGCHTRHSSTGGC